MTKRCHFGEFRGSNRTDRSAIPRLHLAGFGHVAVGHVRAGRADADGAVNHHRSHRSVRREPGEKPDKNQKTSQNAEHHKPNRADGGSYPDRTPPINGADPDQSAGVAGLGSGIARSRSTSHEAEVGLRSLTNFTERCHKAGDEKWIRNIVARVASAPCRPRACSSRILISPTWGPRPSGSGSTNR